VCSAAVLSAALTPGSEKALAEVETEVPHPEVMAETMATRAAVIDSVRARQDPRMVSNLTIPICKVRKRRRQSQRFPSGAFPHLAPGGMSVPAVPTALRPRLEVIQGADPDQDSAATDSSYLNLRVADKIE
jgi:hypothetical protein